MTKRTRICLGIFLVVLATAFVWRQKPESLKSLIEKSDVSLTSRIKSKFGAQYQVSWADSEKLGQMLVRAGSQGKDQVGMDYFGTDYENSTKFFYFWEKKQRVSITFSAFDQDRGWAEFDPDLT